MTPVSYVDDPTIADDSVLWRRICPFWIVPDANRGGFRVSSAAFDDSKDGTPTSIHLEEVARSIGRTAEDILRPFTGYGLASLTAGQARGCEQAIGKDPLPNDPTHGYLAGRKTQSIKKRLAAACQWVIPPPISNGAASTPTGN